MVGGGFSNSKPAYSLTRRRDVREEDDGIIGIFTKVSHSRVVWETL